jgi:hypothetical protein
MLRLFKSELRYQLYSWNFWVIPLVLAALMGFTIFMGLPYDLAYMAPSHALSLVLYDGIDLFLLVFLVIGALYACREHRRDTLKTKAVFHKRWQILLTKHLVLCLTIVWSLVIAVALCYIFTCILYWTQSGGAHTAIKGTLTALHSKGSLPLQLLGVLIVSLLSAGLGFFLGFLVRNPVPGVVVGMVYITPIVPLLGRYDPKNMLNLFQNHCFDNFGGYGGLQTLGKVNPWYAAGVLVFVVVVMLALEFVINHKRSYYSDAPTFSLYALFHRGSADKTVPGHDTGTVPMSAGVAAAGVSGVPVALPSTEGAPAGLPKPVKPVSPLKPRTSSKSSFWALLKAELRYQVYNHDVIIFPVLLGVLLCIVPLAIFYTIIRGHDATQELALALSPDMLPTLILIAGLTIFMFYFAVVGALIACSDFRKKVLTTKAVSYTRSQMFLAKEALLAVNTVWTLGVAFLIAWVVGSLLYLLCGVHPDAALQLLSMEPSLLPNIWLGLFGGLVIALFFAQVGYLLGYLIKNPVIAFLLPTILLFAIPNLGPYDPRSLVSDFTIQFSGAVKTGTSLTPVASASSSIDLVLATVVYAAVFLVLTAAIYLLARKRSLYLQ